MLEDLDRYMEALRLDWLIVLGDTKSSSALRYLAKGAEIGHATALKRRGEEPHFVVGVMERDEARKAGLRYAVSTDYGAPIGKASLSPRVAREMSLLRILDKHKVGGRTAFLGSLPVEVSVPLVNGVLGARLRIEHVPIEDQTPIGLARVTKAAYEIERMRSVARRTEEVVEAALGYVRRCKRDGDRLLLPSGEPLKVGHVKELLAGELARRGLDDHGQTIFAVGREAGFPHSRGDATTEVVAGKTVIFDIFPQEKGGGYYYDMTRTYWVGDVPEAVRKGYAAVLEAFEKTAAAARPGVPCRDLDAMCCDIFEREGYVTKRTEPTTHIGYMHSLGHGVGMDIHERPSISAREDCTDVFEAGQVFTIEPGLYYPDDSWGIRIEETFVLGADGRAETFATLSKDPCLKLQG